MKTVVFVGPSLPLYEARGLLASAVFRPPAAQGDVLTAVEQDGAQVIGLIDGTFLQTLSVWHNELCYVLSRGVVVYGASSMGALRAVETERFGVVGVGKIFEWYRDGVINCDDEVALAHGDETIGFQPLSIPLVNIRASFELAVSRGIMDEAVATEAIGIIRTIYFPYRALSNILRCCGGQGMDEESLHVVERALTTDYVDLKRSDARELLVRMREDLSRPGGILTPAPFTFARSSVFETLYNLDRRVRHTGIEVPLQLIGEYCALHDPKFDEIRAAALNRGIAVFFAYVLELRVSPGDLLREEAEFLRSRDIEGGEKLAEWLYANDLGKEDFQELIHNMALCRRMQRWIQNIRSFDRGSRYFLDELRRQGSYEEWATRAAKEAAMVDAFRTQKEYQGLAHTDPQELAEEHADATGVRIAGNAKLWAADAGFDTDWGLRDALQRSAIARDVQRRIERVSKAIARQVSDGMLDSEIPALNSDFQE